MNDRSPTDLELIQDLYNCLNEMSAVVHKQQSAITLLVEKIQFMESNHDRLIRRLSAEGLDVLDLWNGKDIDASSKRSPETQ